MLKFRVDISAPIEHSDDKYPVALDLVEDNIFFHNDTPQPVGKNRAIAHDERKASQVFELYRKGVGQRYRGFSIPGGEIGMYVQ